MWWFALLAKHFKIVRSRLTNTKYVIKQQILDMSAHHQCRLKGLCQYRWGH